MDGKGRGKEQLKMASLTFNAKNQLNFTVILNLVYCDAPQVSERTKLTLQAVLFIIT